MKVKEMVALMVALVEENPEFGKLDVSELAGTVDIDEVAKSVEAAANAETVEDYVNLLVGELESGEEES